MNGEILRKLRLEKSLTQEELAKKIDVAQSTIRMIELGKRGGSKEVVSKIADFFNVSFDYLEGRTAERHIEEDKSQMIDDFLNTLVDEGVIKDPNDIDEKTVEMILNAVKAQLGYKILKRNK